MSREAATATVGRLRSIAAGVRLIGVGFRRNCVSFGRIPRNSVPLDHAGMDAI